MDERPFGSEGWDETCWNWWRGLPLWESATETWGLTVWHRASSGSCETVLSSARDK